MIRVQYTWPNYDVWPVFMNAFGLGIYWALFISRVCSLWTHLSSINHLFFVMNFVYIV